MSGIAAAADERSETIRTLENGCFGCGPGNPQGLQLRFTVTAQASEGDITAHSTLRLTPVHQGVPGYVHGGIIATLLDEAMSKLNGPLGLIAVTRRMEVDYLRPVPVDAQLTLIARHLRREGRRKLYHEAELCAADGTVLARAGGLFIVLDPAMLPAALR